MLGIVLVSIDFPSPPYFKIYFILTMLHYKDYILEKGKRMSKYTLEHRGLKFFVLSLFASSWAVANITGTVYKDFNLNGQKDGGDAFVSGVSMKATCEDGKTYTATTDANGAYTLTGFPAGNKCRVEADASNAGVGSGPNASGSAPLVDIVPDGSVHNISTGSPATYCQADPDVVMAAMPGYYLHNGTEKAPTAMGTLFKVPTPNIGDFNNNGTIPSKRTTLAKIEDTGAVWGTAWKKGTKDLFVAANLKRYVQLKGDAGAIYKIDNAGAISLFTTVPNATTAAANTAIGARTYKFNHDKDILPFVGRQGLGDIDINEAETELYAVNMNTKELVIINPDTGAIINNVTIPNPYGAECPDEDVRPWALKARGTDVFIGSVCESKVEAGVGAAIQKYNGAIFQTIAKTNSLAYLRSRVYGPENKAQDDGYRYGNWGTGGEDSPILTDIEFTNSGDLVLGYNCRAVYNRYGVLKGDIRKMCLNADGSYTDESSDVVATTCTTHTVNYTGNPTDYLEFYVGDYFGGVLGEGGHPETASGALAQAPGAPNIIVGMVDGTDWNQPGAIGLYSNTTGDKIGAQAVIDNQPDGERLPYGEKAGGIGDVELLCDQAPIEIGNYVWEDTNKDGIQDPNEPAIAGVGVKLFEAGVLVGTATTDAGGHYYFGGINHVNMTGNAPLKRNTSYQIKVALNDAKLVGKIPTKKDTNANAEDQRDNDGDNGVIDATSSTIVYTTGFSNNHTLDFGFLIYEPSIDIEKATNTVDADTKAQAVKVKTGDVVTWSYVVTNNGSEPLADIVVNDDKEGTITCPKTTLSLKESMTCTSKIGEAATEDYENTATATAKGSTTQKTVTDNDLSHYTVEKEPTEEPVKEPNDPVTTNKYRVGTHFWVDSNANGVFDAGEKPIDGAVVELFDTNGNKIAETTTANGGEYGFDVPAGIYQVKFNIPNTPEYEGFVFSNPKANTNNTLNVNSANNKGFTQTVTVGENAKTEGLTMDAGINCGCANVSTDSADTQSLVSMLAMMFFTLMTALYFVRKEEEQNI